MAHLPEQVTLFLPYWVIGLGIGEVPLVLPCLGTSYKDISGCNDVKDLEASKRVHRVCDNFVSEISVL